MKICTCTGYRHCTQCHKAIEQHIHIAVFVAMCEECAARYEQEEDRKFIASVRAARAYREAYGIGE